MLLKQKLPALIGTTVIVAGGIAAYYYLKVQPTAIADPLAAAQVMPESVVMATYVTTAPSAWGELQAFGTPAAQAALRRNLVALQPALLREANLSYEQDIRPWLNGLMIGVLPVTPTDSSPDPSLAPGTVPSPDSNTDPNPDPNPDPSPASSTDSAQRLRPLLLFGIKDRRRALRTANKLRTIAGVTIAESLVSGVTLTEIATPRGVTYTAVLGDFLAISPERAVLEQAIATYRGEHPNWVSQPAVADLLAQDWGMERPLLRVYLPDYPNAQPQIQSGGPRLPTALPALPWSVVQSFALGLGVDDAGLRLQAITQLRETAPGVNYQPASGQVLAHLPSSTLALISGQNLTALWSTLVTPTAGAPPSPWQTLLRQAGDRWGIDVTQVNVDWLARAEFALGAIATTTDASTRGWGGTLVLQVADRPAAAATLAQLDALAIARGYQVNQTTIGDRPVTTWQHPQTLPWLGYGWQDPDVLFVALSGGPNTLEQLALAATHPLSQQPHWRSLIQQLPSPNAGYLYLDVEQITTLLQLNMAQNIGQDTAQNIAPGGPPLTLAQSAPLLPTDAIALLNAVQGIGLTIAWPQPTRGEVTMVMTLKRQR